MCYGKPLVHYTVQQRHNTKAEEKFSTCIIFHRNTTSAHLKATHPSPPPRLETALDSDSRGSTLVCHFIVLGVSLAENHSELPYSLGQTEDPWGFTLG